MKFPCTLKNTLLIIRDHFGVSFASKGLGYLAALLLLLPLLYRYKLSSYQTTMLLTISALADITLLKTTCHFLLLLVGFDTLTYWKELQLIPYTCGSSRPQSNSIQLKLEKQTPASHLYAKLVTCLSVEPVSWTWSCKVGPGRCWEM